MVLPDPAAAVAWLLDTARAALAAGTRFDVETVLVLRAIAPDAPEVAEAVERLSPDDAAEPAGDLGERARRAAASFRLALAAGDETRARGLVSDVETELLTAYRPGRSLGLDADVAMASLLMDFWDAGRQLPHQMMAEELMLIARRVHWPRIGTASLRTRSDAARTLARLHRSTQNPDYERSAVALLCDLAHTFRDHGMDAAHYVLALQAIS